MDEWMRIRRHGRSVCVGEGGFLDYDSKRRVLGL